MKHKRKWPWIVLGVIAVIALSATVFMIYSNSQLQKLAQTDIKDVDLSSIANGTYEGSYSMFPVEVHLTVTVSDHMITQITILKHVNGQGKPAEVILTEVLTAQSLKVDVIAGATYSSKVILKAIQDALHS